MSLLARWRHRRLQRRLALPRLLDAFAAAYPDAVFVEVGANDGEQHDHLRRHILERAWTGVMVEPVPYVFERLRRNYAGIPRVVLENAAIAAQDGERPFFHLRDAGHAERAALPDWYDGIGSFDRDSVLSHAPQMPDIAERIVERPVRTLRFDTLCARHGIERPDLVVVDTEGHDAEIVRSLDLSGAPPRLLVYEHFHLGPPEREACRQHVEAAGFLTLEEGFDTVCLRPDPDDLTRFFERLTPAVGGVAKSDEYLDALHDDRVPLPPGAERDLRDDHPRLRELREAYAALDLPVTRASRWTPARVEAFLDLRHFRGETLITWHYREEPRVTERKYRALLEYVRARDELGLLGRLEEDGAFGCWTFRFPGQPRVSRDLLESVNELGFLERRLGLAGRERLSVLDVGAGYGRLAHRMSTAFANVGDYCCVDAIPESTFLSEYYLRHRGVTPPARVVPLHEVGSALQPGAFDLAVNVHAFSECSLEAVRWWVRQLARLHVPDLLIVPNEPEGILSLEPDGGRRDIVPVLAGAGYEAVVSEHVIDDPAVREVVGVHDRFHLFALTG